MRRKFNPSKRNEEWEDQNLDFIEQRLREAGMKFADEQDKQIMIILLSLIRKRLYEEPEIGQKLRILLRWEEYLKELGIAL